MGWVKGRSRSIVLEAAAAEDWLLRVKRDSPAIMQGEAAAVEAMRGEHILPVRGNNGSVTAT